MKFKNSLQKQIKYYKIDFHLFFNLIIKKSHIIFWGLGIGDWGLGIGDWGLGPIPNHQSPIPNPQYPIPNPHSTKIYLHFK